MGSYAVDSPGGKYASTTGSGREFSYPAHYATHHHQQQQQQGAAAAAAAGAGQKQAEHYPSQGYPTVQQRIQAGETLSSTPQAYYTVQQRIQAGETLSSTGLLYSTAADTSR